MLQSDAAKNPSHWPISHGEAASSALPRTVAMRWAMDVVQVLCLAFLFLAPWTTSNNNADEAGWLMLGGGVLLVLYAGLYPWLPSRRWMAGGAACFGLFLAWTLITTPASLNPFNSLQRWATWAAAWAVVLILSDLNRTRERSRLTLRVLTSATTLYALAGLGLTATQAAHGHLSMAHLNTLRFPNSDCYGAFLMMGFALSLASAFNRTPRTMEWGLALVESGILTLGVLCSGSRMAIVGTVAASIMLIWVAARRKRKPVEILSALTGPAVAFMCLSLLVLVGGMQDPLLRFQQLFEAGDLGGQYERAAQLSVRRIVLTSAPLTVLRSPIWGAGLDNFAVAFQRDRPRAEFRGYVNEAHCEILQVAVETGLVGLVLWLGLFAFALRKPWKRAQDTASTGAMAALLGLAVYGLSNFAQCVATDLVWMGALMGLAFRDVQELLSHYQPAPRWQGLPRSSWFAVALAVLGIWLAGFGVDTIRGNAAYVAAENDGAAYRWGDELVDLGRAIDLRPANAGYRLRRGLLLEKLAQTSGRRTLLQQAGDDMDAAVRLAPMARDVPLEVGRFYERVGRLADAERVLKGAAEFYPQDYRRWEALGQLYSSQGRLRPAAEAFSKAAPNDEVTGQLAGLLVALQTTDGSGAQLLANFRTQDPTAGDVWYDVGLETASLLAQRSPRSSHVVIDLLIDTPTASAKQRLGLARVLLQAGEPDQATTLLRSLVTSREDEGQDVQTQALAALVDVEIAKRRTYAAETDLQTWLERNPWDVQATIRLARIYADTGRVQKAILAYQDAIAHDNLDATLEAALGQLYLKEGDRVMALDAFEEAQRKAPDNAGYQERVKELSR